MTRVVRVDDRVPREERRRALAEAGRRLRAGELVAFPTETVYGLGADATNPAAVRRIFAAKGRPADNPLIVHIEQVERLREVAATIPGPALELAGLFWPGPLTLVLPRRDTICPEVSAGLPTVAVRCPEHPVARELIAFADRPVAAPSANLSGRPSPTRAEHVLRDLGGRIPLLLDGGPCRVGVESTVLDLTSRPPVLLRPGGVTLEELRSVLGRVDLDPGVLGEPHSGPVRSPGMKYRHYAPAAPAWLVEGTPPAVARKVFQLVKEWAGAGERVGLLISEETAQQLGELFSADWPGAGGTLQVEVVGPRDHPEEYARRLFALLRRLDEAGASRILMEGVPPVGMGLAVANRLRRAAGHQVIKAEPGGAPE